MEGDVSLSSDNDKDSRRGQSRFIGYDEEFDRKIRESAKQDLIESDTLQNVLLKIYRGEFDELRSGRKKSSAGPERSEGAAGEDHGKGGQ